MLESINIILFANENYYFGKPKCIETIGNIPVIVFFLNSLDNLKEEYNLNYTLIIHETEKEIIEDEMTRWDFKINILSTKKRDVDFSILYHYKKSNFFIQSDYYMILNIFFPFISPNLYRNFIETGKKKPLIMVGDFKNIKKKYNLLKILKKGERGIFSEKGDLTYLHITFFNENDFKNIFSYMNLYPVQYFYCLFFNIFSLPKFYNDYDLVPFIKEQDLSYLNYLYKMKEKREMIIEMEKLWKKWKELDSIIKKQRTDGIL